MAQKIQEKTEKQKETKNSTNSNTKVENSKSNFSQKKDQKKNIFKPKIIIISAITIIILALFSTIFAITNISNDKILNNYSVSGIDLSNLTKDQAFEKLNSEIQNRKSREYTIAFEDQTHTITEEELEINYNIDEIINTIYSIGRSKNIIKDNFTILSSYFNKKNLELSAYFDNDETKINYFISDLQNNLPGKVEKVSHEIEGDKLIVTPGKEGLEIETDDLKRAILQKAINFNDSPIKINTKTVTPEKITAQELHDLIYVEPKDAYYETEPKFIVYPHVVGVDFAISIEEAQKILDEDKSEYVIPIKSTYPSKLTNDIGTENFPDLLGKFSTNYDASNTARSTNLRLACNKINGTLLLPGETFSYNNVVGKRTVEAGYKNAAIYEKGKVVDGLGGGICQVSSTLYNAVLYANLEIVERRNHGFRTSYIEPGRDATVVYGSTDFKFKNTRNFPIKINASCSGGVCAFEIYGIKEDSEYDISISVNTLSTTPFSTVYEDTTELPEGVTKVSQGGMNGAKTQTYRTLKQNGTVVKTELLSTDIYNPMTKIILRGVPSLNTDPEPNPDSNPTPADVTPPQETPQEQPQPQPEPVNQEPTPPQNPETPSDVIPAVE